MNIKELKLCILGILSCVILLSSIYSLKTIRKVMGCWVLKWALVIGALSLSSVSFASTKTIIISGTVVARNDLTISPVATLSSAGLLNGVGNFTICTILEQSNSGAGYVLTVTSLNGGNSTDLKLAGDSAQDYIAYSLLYDGSLVSFSAGAAVLTDSTGKTAKEGARKNLAITIRGNQHPPEGAYSDTLVLTLAGK